MWQLTQVAPEAEWPTHKAMARGIDGRLTVLLDKLEFELTNGGFRAEKETAGGHAVEGRDHRGRLPITESWFEVMSGYIIPRTKLVLALDILQQLPTAARCSTVPGTPKSRLTRPGLGLRFCLTPWL